MSLRTPDHQRPGLRLLVLRAFSRRSILPQISPFTRLCLQGLRPGRRRNPRLTLNLPVNPSDGIVYPAQPAIRYLGRAVDVTRRETQDPASIHSDEVRSASA